MKGKAAARAIHMDGVFAVFPACSRDATRHKRGRGSLSLTPQKTYPDE
jgi:hypothetical protein